MRTLDEEKRQIVAAIAKDLFLSLGFKKTSISKIAKKAKLAVGTIYLYYPSKTDLLKAVVDEHLEQHKKYAQRIVDSHDNSSSKIRKYLHHRFTAVRSLCLNKTKSAELINQASLFFPKTREQETELLVNTVAYLLQEAKNKGELKFKNDVQKEAYIFLHAIAWFFPHAGDVHSQEPTSKALDIMLDWFFDHWQFKN